MTQRKGAKIKKKNIGFHGAIDDVDNRLEYCRNCCSNREEQGTSSNGQVDRIQTESVRSSEDTN